MSKSRVFVVQENNYADYSDAERYGEVIFMTVDEFRPMAASLKNEQIVEGLKCYLATFTPDDYLILTGNPTVIGLAFMLAFNKVAHHGVKILQWDKITGTYKPFTFYYDTLLDI